MKPLNIEAVRAAALLRNSTTIEDVVDLLSISDEMGKRMVSFAWATVAHRTLMSILPSFENLNTYNERKRALIQVLRIRGIEGKLSEEDIEGLIELGGRIQQSKSGLRKSSWGDLHYSTRRDILLRQNHRCVACGIKLNLGESGLKDSPELDHIIPFAMKGNIESNTRVICKRCNGAKHDNLTYITQARLSVNDNSRTSEGTLERLFYWALELAGSKCENLECGQTSHLGRLYIVKVTSLLPWQFDNVKVLCSCCSNDSTRFPL